MNKKIIIKIVLGIACFGFLFCLGKSIYDLSKEQIISEEIKEIDKVISLQDFDNDSVNEILDRTKISKGEYKKIEESLKSYYKDLYNTLKDIDYLLGEENDYNYLSSDNLSNDGPSFIKSKETISNTKAQISDIYDNFNLLLNDEETILAYLDEDTNSYYTDFYKENIEIIKDNEYLNSIESIYNEKINELDIYNEALDFLVKNSDHWEIKDDLIAFDDTDLYDEYVTITNKLNNDEEE